MAKLILSLEGSVIREIPINKERIMIGRKAQNDIQIENLAVSGEHACIVTILADSFLEDLGSTNGTLVNGNQVKKHILQNNDVIEIGKYKMKYLVESVSGQPPAEDFEKTMVMRSPAKPAAAAPKPAPVPAPVSKPAAPAPAPAPAPVFKPAAPAPAPKPVAAPAPAPAAPKPAAQPAAASASVPAAPAPKPAAAPAAGEAHPLAALQLLTGGAAGREIELVKNLTTLGKPGVQVAVITRRPQGYFITHVEGTNFPVINGKTLDNQARQLNDHDVIELAGVKMEFFIKK
jgi:pSer/pThr/pTyr-binding forkhead associated (FHA) protein